MPDQSRASSSPDLSKSILVPPTYHTHISSILVVCCCYCGVCWCIRRHFRCQGYPTGRQKTVAQSWPTVSPLIKREQTMVQTGARVSPLIDFRAAEPDEEYHYQVVLETAARRPMDWPFCQPGDSGPKRAHRPRSRENSMASLKQSIHSVIFQQSQHLTSIFEGWMLNATHSPQMLRRLKANTTVAAPHNRDTCGTSATQPSTHRSSTGCFYRRVLL